MIIFVLNAIALVLLPLVAVAEPNPSQFFKKGYASSPLDAKAGGSPGDSRQSRPDKGSEKSASPFDSQGVLNSQQDSDSRRDSLEREPAVDRGPLVRGGVPATGSLDGGDREGSEFNKSVFAEGKEVVSLGVIVNSLNASHAVAILEDLAKKTKKLGLPASPVILVGTQGSAAVIFQQINAHDPTGLTAYELLGSLIFSMNIPEKYPVRSSPSWVVRTTGGEYVLDGVQSLDRYVTSDGRFYDPDAIVVGLGGHDTNLDSANNMHSVIPPSAVSSATEAESAGDREASDLKTGAGLFDKESSRAPLVDAPRSWEQK